MAIFMNLSNYSNIESCTLNINISMKGQDHQRNLIHISDMATYIKSERVMTLSNIEILLLL